MEELVGLRFPFSTSNLKFETIPTLCILSSKNFQNLIKSLQCTCYLWNWHALKMQVCIVVLCFTINWYHYSFKIFPQFWLAKSVGITHHNLLLMTKFGRILEDLRTRMICFGCENKNTEHLTRFKSNNYSWN